MQIIITQSKLSTLLAIASQAIPARPLPPILGSLLVEADVPLQRITITAFDLSLGIRIWSDCTVLKGGAIAIPARLFEKLVTTLPKGDVSIETNGSTATITHLTGSVEIQTADADDFPLPLNEEGTRLHIDAQALQHVLRATLFAASTEETKQILSGVHITVESDYWEAAATDAHRLAIARTQITSTAATTKQIEATLPSPTVSSLEKILISESGTCSINITESMVTFDFDNLRVTSRLIQGHYPKYRDILPKNNRYSIIVQKRAFVEALRRTSLLSDQRLSIVRMRFDPLDDQATLYAHSNELGHAVDSMSVTFQCETEDVLEVAFNTRYLFDALKAILSEEITLEMNGPLSPVIIRPGEALITQEVLLMPIQLSSPEPPIPEPRKGISTEVTAIAPAPETQRKLVKSK